MAFPESDLKPARKPTDEERRLARSLDLPVAFLILMRAFTGMQAVVARLGPEQAWRHVAAQIWPSTGAPPTTELGRREAPWLLRQPG